MKIDIYAHIFPQKYKEAIAKIVSPAIFEPFQAVHRAFPDITNLEGRFVSMDRHDGYTQILTHTVPFMETITKPKDTIELVKLGNDELAELVAKYPERFPAAIANLPVNNLDAALNELDRAINVLHLKGIQICTDINGKSLDSPEFLPIFEKMEKYDLPIYLHPARAANVPDYPTETTSKYKIHHLFGWPYDTSACMVRLVLSHVLEKYPKLKIITHHCGAMIPFFDMRLLSFLNGRDMEYCTKDLSKPPLEYFKMFYGDTALQGSTPGLMCGYAFFGADHILFGTDSPFGDHGERTVVDLTIQSVEQMNISPIEKKKIFEDNAKKILKLH
jgi:predicted TIM-barrel fold metal-dependent hydrolase